MRPLDFDYAPAGYRDAPGPTAALLLNVKGDLRRRLLRDVAGGRGGIGLGSPLWSETSSDFASGILGRAHPQWLGGEFLPDYLPGEVEIARVTLANVTRDVISVRARGRRRGYRYRIVDEYGARWTCRPRTTVRPLPMWRLIGMIDSACFGRGHWVDLTDELRAAHGGEPAEAAGFVEVASELYPDLEEHYRRRAALWLAHHAPVARGEGPRAPADAQDPEEPWAR